MKRIGCIAVLTLVVGMALAQQADRRKMSAMLVDKLNASVASARGTEPAAEEYILTLVKLNSGGEEALTQRGCVVIDRVGSISIALLPVGRLGELSLDDRVVRMEANPLSRPMLDVTPGVINAEPAYHGEQLPQAYTGYGVVVGVADVGFDFTHPMFKDTLGQTRIRQAWDIYTGGTNGYKGIGTLYTTPEALAAARGTCDSTQHHGTHVAAIAAGSTACGGRYQGIAPEADIVMSLTYLSSYTQEQFLKLLGSLNAALKTGTDSLIYDVANNKITLSSAMEVLAIKHAMDYATEHGQPCVVNCSFGSQERLTDDTSVEEELFNSLTGPGRIIVCSAGNYSDGLIYKFKDDKEWLSDQLWLKSSLTPTLTLRSAGDFTLKLHPDIDGADTLVITAARIRQAGSDGRTDSASIDGSIMKDSWVRAVSRAYDGAFPGQTSYAVNLTLPTPTSAYRTPSLDMVLTGDATEVMGQWSALTFNRLNAGNYVSNAPYTVSKPSLYAEVISVGVTSHRDSVTNLAGQQTTHNSNGNQLGLVVSWSGTGPTLDGRMKPDVVAPGFNIVSALNSNLVQTAMTDNVRNLIVDTANVDRKKYYWKAESGSSMSAPVMTGVIALWLQANPQLTPDDIRQILAQTARHPEADETYPNYRYGYGEVDAYKGLLYLTELAGVEGLSDHQPRQVSFRLTGRTLTLTGTQQAAITVYAIGGQMVMRTQTTSGTIDLSSLRPGVYAVQINTGDAETTGSTLVRLQ